MSTNPRQLPIENKVTGMVNLQNLAQKNKKTPPLKSLGSNAQSAPHSTLSGRLGGRPSALACCAITGVS